MTRYFVTFTEYGSSETQEFESVLDARMAVGGFLESAFASDLTDEFSVTFNKEEA